MCKAVGVKVKTSHSLRVTCATALFEKGVEEKLIRDRAGHRSNALHLDMRRVVLSRMNRFRVF